MTDRYVVIGNPVAHSKSPRIHTLFAAATGQDLRYEPLLAPLDGFALASVTILEMRADWVYAVVQLFQLANFAG